MTTKSVANAEAKRWREKYERLLASLNDVVKRCHLMHGDDPMHQWFVTELLKLREKYGTNDEGEEWKKP